METRITLCPATADISIGDYFRFHRALLPSCSKDEISRLDWTLAPDCQRWHVFLCWLQLSAGPYVTAFLSPTLTEWVFLIQGLTQIGKSFFKNLIKMFHRQSVCVYVLIFMFILHIYLSLCISSTPVQQHWSALFIVRCVFPYGLICCSVSVPDWSPSFVFQRCIWSGFVCFGFSWCFVVQYIENLFKKNTATKCNLNFTSRRFLLYLKN